VKIPEDLTLRDYFAAKALQGFAAQPGSETFSPTRLATDAYEWADAMLKAREQGEKR
jgi:hypothetical protein